MMLPPDRQKRYLLCRPTGGLTDMLCQIGRCIKYTQRHRRRLIIDTNLQKFFAEDFESYFIVARSLRCQAKLRRQQIPELHKLSCNPAALAGRLDSYKAEQIPAKLRQEVSQQLGHFTNQRDANSLAPLSFNFRIDHPEDLLIHHCSGNQGVEDALTALWSVWPQPWLRRRIRRRLQKLPSNYEALHVRHTDLKSDLHGALTQANIDTFVPLVIASDSHQAILAARLAITKRPLYLASQPINPIEHGLTSDATTHKDASMIPRKTVNLAALVDLFVLANATSLKAAEMLPGQCKTTSGYFQLALALQARKDLLHRFTC